MADESGEATISLSRATKFIVDNRGRTVPTVVRGIPLIATNCVSNDHLYPLRDKLRYVSQETHDTWFRAHPQPGDILLTTKGSQNGAVCLVPEPVDFVIAQDMVAVRANEEVIDPLFLFAALRSRDVQRQIKNLDVSGVIPHFKKGDFDKLYLPYPNQQTQHAVGLIYFNLSAKIELNRRMNETLEAMARALFKSWFVDFDPVRAKAERRDPGLPKLLADLFPDSFEHSEVGDIPKGWSVSILRGMIETIKGRSYKSEELADSDTALVTLKSFARGGGYRPDGLKPFTGTYKPEQVVNPGELVIACTDVTQAAEVIGRPALVTASPLHKKLVASLDTIIVRPRSTAVTKSFLYFLMGTQDFAYHTYAYTTGTTVLHLAKEAVPSYKFACPATGLVRMFDDIASSILNRIQSSERESHMLAELRDTLLHELISGELRTRSAERLLEKAV